MNRNYAKIGGRDLKRRTLHARSKRVLTHTLPDPNHSYNLRPRRHELTLAIKGDAINIFQRQLFKDIQGGPKK